MVASSEPLTKPAVSQRVHDDGRVELVDPTVVASSSYHNHELAPTPVAQRRWGTYSYAALWIGMAFNVPSYLLAAGLMDPAIGMNWLQAFLTVTAGNVIVLVPMLLNSHAGTKYGIPYPVFARAFYGVRGANLPALLRAFVACGWFGIQTWVGGAAIFTIVGALAGERWTKAASVAGQPWTLWAAFVAFWAIQILIIMFGMEAVRKLEVYAAPLMILGLAALSVWALTKAGGLGPILDQPSKLGWGPKFWAVFAPSLMGMIAFWATLSLNMPDFTRFARGQRQQAIGQVLGLPTMMAVLAIMSIIITSATVVIFGEAVWDPIEVVGRISSPVAVIGGLVVVVLATLTTNLAANVVSPSYDFSNAVPKLISFRIGGLITGVLGIAVMPWKLAENAETYINGWLNFYGGVLASVAGVLVAGYWVHARTRLELADLYRKGGRYWFTAGWNIRAVVATAVGALLAVGGAYSTVNPDTGQKGPFPEDGLIPALKMIPGLDVPFYNYSWVIGFVTGFVLYALLALITNPGGTPARVQSANQSDSSSAAQAPESAKAAHATTADDPTPAHESRKTVREPGKTKEAAAGPTTKAVTTKEGEARG